MNQHSSNAREFSRDGDKVIWVSDGENCRYAALFNTGDTECEITLPLDGARTVYDIWAKKELGKVTDLTVPVAPHGAKLYKIQ